MMNRVVITGLGIVSSIGNSAEEVVQSLQTGRSGMIFMPEMMQLGYRCCVYAPVSHPDMTAIPRKARRTMSDAACFAAVAALDAVRDAALAIDTYPHDRIGVIVGTGAGGVNAVPDAKIAIESHHSASRVGALGIIKIMNTTASGNLAVLLGTTGRVRSISAACCTGLYNIGYAYELIRNGLQDACITGSTEEDTWKQVGLSADNSNGMPVDYNDKPQEACRPYDRDRQGFIISAGSGILVLENLDHAINRGARIYAEIAGYDEANDGNNMFLPSGEGLETAIRNAMSQARHHGVDQIDYINPHGAGTRTGDQVEAAVMKHCFGQQPHVSSTKSIAGHAQSATASQEAVFTVLMMNHSFIAPTRNLVNIDPACDGINHVTQLIHTPVNTAVTFNAGLGGTNACLVLKKYRGESS